ncbi:endonuclease III [Telluribacter sp.]|jgi:endonuclease-3|uniref:endonuclease III domain-containing protein n=1 Tax=Telluribacter sp. TaxID=1978767 RepID=UPI002E12A09F|nr:endonuclease III [Telluribacter sp.]
MKPDFDLNSMLLHIEEAIRPYPKAAMFELAERGYTTLFEQLISCIISIRTLDETTIPVSLRLFARARTPEQLLRLSPEQLTELLEGSSYPGQKAYTMRGVAEAAVNQYNHELPAEFEKLTALKGVGPKCANLALGVAAGHSAISVDVHVHRVVNRWGYIQTRQPEKTMKVLEEKVPETQWTEINRLLMPFGKHICTGILPRCSTCPVLLWCRQVGVTKHR